MMMGRQATFYFCFLLIFGAALWFVIGQGKSLESRNVEQPVAEAVTALPSQTHFFSSVQRNIHHPLALLVIQILCIMIAARGFGHLMIKIGQPSVIGEIAAGIALGPSLMGIVFPGFSTFLFPEESLPRLHVLSQIGLVLFMFIIGMEIDISVFKKKAKAAVIVSHVSIIFPYFLGVLLAYFLYPSFAPKTISFTAFALFMGIAMSITAFPVLARIVQERNLAQSPIGTVVLTCAAADDITAWCLLALVAALVSAGGILSALGSIILAIIYVVVMWFVVRPLLHLVAFKYDSPESIDKTVVAFIFGMLLISSFLTEVIGIHALFGAFFAGVIMPARKEFKLILAEKIEDISLVLLLPLFFVFTGLRTEIGLLNQVHLWGVCLLIIGVAVVGKFAGSAIAARLVGQSWRDSFLIGALMNTRGLMELVVLNIGYDLGVLSAEIFTMMVIMALATTLMTGPALSAIEFFLKPQRRYKGKARRFGFHSLISFGAPQSGSRLLELAHALNLKNTATSSITAAHFSPSADISIMEAEQHEKEAFLPIDRTAERLGISVGKIFRVTDNVERAILDEIHQNSYDFVLLGGSRQLFADDKTAGKVRTILHETNAAVGIFIDRDFQEIQRAMFIVSGNEDSFLLRYARIFQKNDRSKEVSVKASAEEGEVFDSRYDIVIASFHFWERLQGEQRAWLHRMPSVLVINK